MTLARSNHEFDSRILHLVVGFEFLHLHNKKFGGYIKIHYIYIRNMELNIHIHKYRINQKQILKQLKQIMANITELTAKVDALQVALDAEQDQIVAAIAALQQTVVDLQALVVDGGTPEQRQALADKLDAVVADLQATIPDAPQA